MSLIDEGRRAPAFKLLDQDGQAHRLKDYLGRPVVLYFYPKDDTESCTREACDFRDALPEFGRLTAAVLGISPDSVESHRAFASRHNLSFPLLADPPSTKGVPRTCDLYGTWREKTLYGRRYFGVVRTTYLVDEAGKVQKRWDNVRVAGHVESVVEAVCALRRGNPLAMR